MTLQPTSLDSLALFINNCLFFNGDLFECFLGALLWFVIIAGLLKIISILFLGDKEF